MINVKTQVRLAQPADRNVLADAIFFDTRVHRHLDFRSPLEWLGSPYFWVMEDEGRVAGALACPEEPPGVAWVRLFLSESPALTPRRVWALLWEQAKRDIARNGGATVAAISLRRWFREILRESRFEEMCRVLSLSREARTLPSWTTPKGISLRVMRDEDIPEVAAVDASAFAPLWRNSSTELHLAFRQAMYAAVAESEGRLVGYQISVQTPFGAHLARLAVRNGAQGRGIGSALLGDLVARLANQGVFRLSVNTQSDNEVSLKLYGKFDFHRTGEAYPVYAYDVSPET